MGRKIAGGVAVFVVAMAVLMAIGTPFIESTMVRFFAACVVTVVVYLVYRVTVDRDGL